MRQGVENGCDGREEAGQNQDPGSGKDGPAVDHLGHGDQTDVLGERGQGHDAEQASHGRDETVSGDGPGRLLGRGLPVEADIGQGGGVSQDFHRRYQVEQGEGDDGAPVEDRFERQEVRQGDRAEVMEGGEVDLMQNQGQDIADDKAEEDGQLLGRAFCQELEAQAAD